MSEENQMYGLNLKKISEYPDFCAVTRMTAQKLMKQPYMTLGDFFKGLTNNDMTSLLFMVEMAPNDPKMLDDMLCLCEMLAHAEGAPSTSIDESTLNVNYFGVLVTVESLSRKGLVTVFHENMSFGSELGDKPVAIAKDGSRQI